jgi:hypothetical protein
LAIQKNLPRPFAINEKIYGELIENEKIPAIRREAEKLLSEEMYTILAQDALDYPFQNSKVIEKRLKSLKNLFLNFSLQIICQIKSDSLWMKFQMQKTSFLKKLAQLSKK